jgi:hypothetical protein
MKQLFLMVAFTAALTSSAAPQAMKCPICSGPNKALQYDGSTCYCATISGVVGPAGPPGPAMPASTCPVEGYTERWNGTAWVCTPTKYLIGE